ncbi:MAG: bifunctional UDP-N-acetylglucosamine diphosphorylase/glucosamine-1-phosphate N-acetyltransferase GlmU [Proteobacteria bacterium]|nr:bifunctional UDP-N-acetylglucosamine diphosphorylase/glucosamine-1-phosphate N-acetyltransferase GlmU [Pseudomonadota bacterium]
MPLSIIILAAGQGKRMQSARAKVIHQLAGKSMLQHVVDTSQALDPDQIIVVVGHQSSQVRESMKGQGLSFVEQAEQKGTGHAVQQCLKQLNEGNDVLVLYGDVPLISIATIRNLLEAAKGSALNILSFLPENSQGYGRIIRAADGSVRAIVEEKEATADDKKIQESNTGILLIEGSKLRQLIGRLENNNVKKEYYLTDLVKLAVQDGLKVSAILCADAREVNGVNDQHQLAEVESRYRQIQASLLLKQGVKLYDPARIDVRGDLQVGSDVEIDINCIFEGTVKLGDRVRIGANCVIRDTTIAADSVVLPMTSIDQAVIGSQVSIGPFARIRPGTECADGSKIGNFVETKKTTIGAGSKVNHLSYIGDTQIGREVNIGAGTITCNYDGVNKHRTIIEDGVFIGSDTQLVAPVTIAEGSTIGAGSTITRDTPAQKLSLSRSRQITIDAWKRPGSNK